MVTSLHHYRGDFLIHYRFCLSVEQVFTSYECVMAAVITERQLYTAHTITPSEPALGETAVLNVFVFSFVLSKAHPIHPLALKSAPYTELFRDCRAKRTSIVR